jgi:CTP synthase
MPEHHPGQMGGTMRLGKRTTIFKDTNSILKQLYGNLTQIDERHRHRYEVNPEYVEAFEAKGLKFVGHDSEQTRMEIMELEGHPYYVATQFHPEYLSRPLKPSPPFMGFILASVGKLQNYLNHGCRMSPKNVSDEELSSDEEEMMRRLRTTQLNVAAAKDTLKVNGFANGSYSSGSGAGSSSQDEMDK